MLVSCPRYTVIFITKSGDSMANILIVGATGGREHAAGEALYEEGNNNVSFTHGNAGTAEFGENLGLKTNQEIADYADPSTVDLAWIGPEAPLIDGIADEFRSRGVPTFGPGADGAQAEASKEWFALFAKQEGIPQPDFHILSSLSQARLYLRNYRPEEYVIKANGQAGGKGVVLPKDQQEAEATFGQMLSGEMFGNAGKRIVAQKRLDPRGSELSAYYVMDGTQFSLVGVARDYKRIGEGDTGKNTGGMGAYSPIEVSPELSDQLMDIGDRVLHGFVRRNIEYRGVVFLGGMIDVEDDSKLKALEANVRFGDPESQVVIPRLGKMGINFFEMMNDVAHGQLDASMVGDLSGGKAEAFISVCIAAEDYPDTPRKGDAIHGLDKEYEGVNVYHGGTVRAEDGTLKTAGGRVLYITASGETIDLAASRAYAAIGEHAIHFTGFQYRADIAWQDRGKES